MSKAKGNPNWKHILSQIQEGNRVGFCSICGWVRLHRTKREHTGEWRCQNSKNLGQKIRREINDFYKDRDIRRKGKAAERRKFLISHCNHCEICGTKFNLVYDHNHKTNQFRGTLCRHCNVGIGFLKDNIHLVIRAAEYLLNRGTEYD